MRRCRECAGRRLAFAHARSAVAYRGSVTVFVTAWKERGLRGLAGVAARVIAEALPRPECHALTFVPPDGERTLSRGHHPAERLAIELGELWELPTEAFLGRSRQVGRQRGLRLADRRRNVLDAFVPLGRAPPRTLILVDDVYTSGATAASAASVLRRAGARKVDVVTFARAVR